MAKVLEGMLLVYLVAGTVAGVALHATEDALKLAFALDSLDSPDPFAHEALVPDAVEEATIVTGAVTGGRIRLIASLSTRT